MSEDQKSKYEEAAKEYRDNNFIEGAPLHTYSPIIFMRGTEHAHPIGFNLGKEEGKKEGWNEALDKVIDAIQVASPEMTTISEDDLLYDISVAIKKLRK